MELRFGPEFNPGALAQAPPMEVVYLEMVESMPLERWQMLTGLETTDPDELATKYIEVVHKKLQKTRTVDFSDWLTASGAPITDDQRALAEQVLAEFNAAIEVVAVQGTSDGLTATYHVVVDPSLAQGLAEQHEEPVRSPMLPLMVAFGIGAIGTSLLVRKGVGLKLLAGAAGGVFATVATASFLKARTAQEEEEELVAT